MRVELRGLKTIIEVLMRNVREWLVLTQVVERIVCTVMMTETHVDNNLIAITYESFIIKTSRLSTLDMKPILLTSI
jgi:hypothetical protein